MRKLLIFIMVCLALPVFAALIDINTATLDELKTLPIDAGQAQDIYDYRHYEAFFGSIYDLRNIPSIDQKTLLKIRDLVTVSHFSGLDEVAQRRDELGYLLERIGDTEGIQEGFTDIWEDFLMTPQNINEMYFNDVLNIPDVSPVDAAAILKRRADGDTLIDFRDLRNTPGLSYYGARNLKNYVVYKNTDSKDKLYLNYQFKYDDRGYEDAVEEMFKNQVVNKETTLPVTISRRTNLWGFFGMNKYQPSTMQKLRVRYNQQDLPWKAGILFQNQRGEKNFTQVNFSEAIKDAKYYTNWNYNFNTPFKNSLNFYFGNYRATYGEGLVMENTDYYNSRKTGLGFSKRILGITGDLSRSDEYALKGTAVDYRNPYFGASFFYSQDKKDALVYDTNADGFINSADMDSTEKYNVFSYVTPSRRFSDSEMEAAEAQFKTQLYSPMKLAMRTNFLDEKITGYHLEVTPMVGTSVGYTYYNAVYDNANFIVPKTQAEASNLLIRDSADYDAWKMVDTETLGGYSTITDKYVRDYRNVMGFDFRTVIDNTSIQGEYAELQTYGVRDRLTDDPKAIVVSSYSQFENFYFLALYRSYDLDFDNSYSRGFSEHERLTDTMIDGDSYTMTNPLVADVYINSAQAQAEKGVYFETRYKFNNYFTLNKTYFDVWERVADGRRSARFQGELEYRPIFNLSFRLKYKAQVNRYDEYADRSISKTSELTPMMRVSLSNRDMIALSYVYSKVWFPPYPYMSGNAEPNADNLAEATCLLNGNLIGVDYTHYFNDDFKINGSFLYWNGHGMSLWDWEDSNIDFMEESGSKYWFNLQDRIANNLYLSLKYRVKTYRTKEYDFRMWWNEEITDSPSNFKRVENSENSVSLQLDWKF